VSGFATLRGAAALAAAGLSLAACAQSGPHAGAVKTPPVLHIGDLAAPANGAAERPTPSGAVAGRYVLAGSLPTGPSHAAVWQWPNTTASKDDVVRLARALGITSTPQRHVFGWVVASATGELRVHDGSGDTWSYVRADLQSCPPYGVDVDDPMSGGFGCASAGAATVVAPQPNDITSPAPRPSAPTAPTTPIKPMGPDDATTRAASSQLLSALGLSGDEHVDIGTPASTLTASPIIGGLPTSGLDTRIDVDGHGIRAAMGTLMTPQPGDAYPLISARTAFTKLALLPQPMIAMYCGPLPPVGAPERISSSPDAGTTSPDAVTPAHCASPAPLRVTGARLGLGLQTSYDSDIAAERGTVTEPAGPVPVGSTGTELLVPEWLFTIADSVQPVPIVAIEPQYLGSPDYVGSPTAIATASAPVPAS